MTKHNEIHQDERVQLYEIGFLVVPTVAQEQLPGVVSELHKVLKTHKAEIIMEDAPILRDLAYEIAKVSVGKRQKFSKAYFGSVVFKAASEVAPLIQKELEANDTYLRFILIKTDKETALTPKIVPEALEGLKTEEVAPISPEDIDKKIDTLVTA